MEKYRAKRRLCFLAALDLKNAFDRLPRLVSGERDVPGQGSVRWFYDKIRTPHGLTEASRPERAPSKHEVLQFRRVHSVSHPYYI
ncbi:unnamed protein product [Haemonchus placei]|uniref:Reverse transcriptase domain-containing protein n=1 Tax=Haemonchus placei TaxID=6290 RepID=A0A0N4VSH1_HAEPC|nr:unnamed protein product [Haemonchus placei]